MISVLFVDDEPNVLAGLQRMLRPLRHEWSMQFAGSGAECLEALKHDRVDVVVTDMRMPGMSGSELLERIACEYPGTVRIVLSGQADRESMNRAATTTHQLLSKPCNSDTLIQSIRRACRLKELLANEQLSRIVCGARSLPSVPKVYADVMRLFDCPDTSVRQIGEAIAADPAMTAKMLQLVNSAFYGLPRRIASPVHAVSLLGLETVRSLVVVCQVFSQYRPEEQVRGFSLDHLWAHSLRVARTARGIAECEVAGRELAEEAFTAGLLHDVGKLLLAASIPKAYAEALAESRRQGLREDEAEREIVGVTHAEAGAYLMDLWGLPCSIVEAIAFHHRPAEAHTTEFTALTAVHAADALDSAHYEAKLSVDGEAPARLDRAYIEDAVGAGRLEAWREIWRNGQRRDIAA